MTTQQNIEEQATRLYKRARSLSVAHRYAGDFWGNFNVLLGLPTVVAAGGAGISAFEGHESLAGVLGVLAAVCAALSTYLNTAERGRRHRNAQHVYGKVAEDANLFAEVGSNLADNDQVRGQRLTTLVNRFGDVFSESPPVAGFFRRKAEAELAEGWEGHARRIFYRLISPFTLVGIGFLILLSSITFTVSGWSGPFEDDGEEATLSIEDKQRFAERFAPVLRLNEGEFFLPIDRPRYLRVSNLVEVTSGRRRVLEFNRAPSGLPESLTCPVGTQCFLGLDIEDAEPRQGNLAYARVQDGILPADDRPTVYWNVRKSKSTANVAVQFWFLYLFNGFENYHEADWEQVTIRLDASGDPKEMFYSAHGLGRTLPWSSVPKAPNESEHPVVFVALHSHANYARRATHRVDLKCWQKKRRVLTVCLGVRGTATDTSLGCGTILVPVGLSLTARDAAPECSDVSPSAPPRQFNLRRLTRPSFVGYYGIGNFLVKGRVPAGEKGPNDPQRRGAWRAPLVLLARGR